MKAELDKNPKLATQLQDPNRMFSVGFEPIIKCVARTVQGEHPPKLINSSCILLNLLLKFNFT